MCPVSLSFGSTSSIKGLKSLGSVAKFKRTKSESELNYDQQLFDFPQYHHTNQQIDGDHFHLIVDCCCWVSQYPECH